MTKLSTYERLESTCGVHNNILIMKNAEYLRILCSIFYAYTFVPETVSNVCRKHVCIQWRKLNKKCVVDGNIVIKLHSAKLVPCLGQGQFFLL